MKTSALLLTTAAAVALAAPAVADTGQPAPSMPIFSLTGLPQSTTFTRYGFSFTATEALTNLTFAFRNDPRFLRFDDVSLSTGGRGNLLVNGGFEDGPGGAAAPVGWSYLNQYGASAGGKVSGNGARTGSVGYYDGAIGAYDAITQQVVTSIGATYDVSFWSAVDVIGGTGLYQQVSSNGSADYTGNGIDLFAYVGAGAPVLAVPEPATWAMMIAGFGFVGGAMRVRRRRVAVATA